MAENSKNPFIDLSQEDKHVLDKCALNYLMSYYSMTEKYPDPKQYVIKKASKILESDKGILNIISLLSIQNNPAPINPLNQKI